MPSTEVLYHNEKPLFFSTKASFCGVTLYLDFNKKDKLQGLYYTLENPSFWSSTLSKMATLLEGKTFAEIQEVKLGVDESRPFFDLPLFLLKEALEEYRGKVPPLHELKKAGRNDLLCRCFGIYRQEVYELLLNHPDYKPVDITNATKAGAGCTSCLINFEELYAEAKVLQAKKLLES